MYLTDSQKNIAIVVAIILCYYMYQKCNACEGFAAPNYTHGCHNMCEAVGAKINRKKPCEDTECCERCNAAMKSATINRKIRVNDKAGQVQFIDGMDVRKNNKPPTAKSKSTPEPQPTVVKPNPPSPQKKKNKKK